MKSSPRRQNQDYEDSSVKSISADTIRLFNSIVIELTTELIHRAIALQEQEYQMKGRIKVWHTDTNDEVCGLMMVLKIVHIH